MKILTFVIPAYNSEKFLDKCVTSMLVPNTLSELEIIIVNDGSTDRTPEIASEYVNRYPDTVRLLSQANAGHGGALNTGCAAAQGKYLKVIDADDWIFSENLPSFLTALKKYDSDVILTPYTTVDISNGEEKNWRCYPKSFDVPFSFDDIMENWKNFDRVLTMHGICYRTSFYQAFSDKLPEKVFYEDHYYATFPSCYAKSITAIDLFIYAYRIGDCNQSVSEENQLKRLEHTQVVIESMCTKLLTLPPCSGKKFAMQKTQDLLLSYLTISLLVDPNRSNGRRLAKDMLKKCCKESPEIVSNLHTKSTIFLIMNFLHLRKKHWDYIRNSKLYNFVRRNHNFA